MCFSAEASFVGGVIISAIGVATIKKVHDPSQLLFASIPLFFGVQQLIEGVLWYSFSHHEFDVVHKLSTYAFLVMAQVLWPTMIPLSVLFMEKNKKIKKILQGFLVMGIILSLYFSYCLVFFNVTPEIVSYHIRYQSDFPSSFKMLAFIIYLIVTIAPLFVSSNKKTSLLGTLMFLSCLVTGIFFTQYLTSVWCFFAAIISGVVYWILRDSKIKFTELKLTPKV